MIDLRVSEALDNRHSVTNDELRWLAEQAQQAQVIIELGCFWGRSTRALADNTPGIVHAVDTWAYHGRLVPEPYDPYTVFCHNLQPHLASQKVQIHRMTSEQAWPSLPAADLIFIDTDHSYRTTQREVALYRQRLTATGLLSGHDYDADFPGVITAVDEAFGTQVGHCGGVWWWIR